MTQCTATTRKGTQCKNLAAPGTNPPRCSIPSHQISPNTLVRKQAGAPKGNKNAKKHGAYSRSALPAQTSDIVTNIANAIADLQQKRKQLSIYIDNQDDLAPLVYAKMLDLLGRLDSRIARLYKQLQELTGESANTAETDVDAVLEVLSIKFGIDLTGEKK